MKQQKTLGWNALRWFLMVPAAICTFLMIVPTVERLMYPLKYIGVEGRTLADGDSEIYLSALYFWDSFVPVLVALVIAPNYRMRVGMGFVAFWGVVVPLLIGGAHPMALIGTFLAMGLVHWGELRIARRQSTPSAL